MKLPLTVLCLFVGATAGLRAAENTPLEIRQHLTPYNLQSTNGVPISGVAGTPPGSDGRMPAENQSAGSNNPPTAGQFQSLVSFGGSPGLIKTDWEAVKGSALLNAGVTAFNADVAEQMKLPVARSNNVVVMVLRRAQIGAPFQSRGVSFLFGSVIPAPETDAAGLLLPEAVKESFWLPEPYSANNHTNAPYYWSPNARQVFAIQAGPLAVTWKQAAPVTDANVLANYSNANGLPTIPSFQTNGGNIFLLYTARYIASGSAVKTPRKMYWTEGEFRTLGKPVAVPTARVGGVTVVYNSNFPRTVDQEYRSPGHTSPTDGGTNQPLPELRTLWYDQSQAAIFAFNQEGRVFLELLGDARPDNSRQFLGFEIVDVFRQPVPTDVPVELGERIIPPPPGSLVELFPEPVQQPGQGVAFAHQQNVAGADGLELYAIRETVNLNDYMVHWLKAGLQGLRWPDLFARYRLVWPVDEARYSHYLRPLAATEAEARKTAVPLATENVPTLEYQDPLDRPRAKFTEDFKFYTWLDAAHPAHRTLLRFTAGEHVAFERVFSWLDVNLKDANHTGVATNLTAVANFPAAQAKYESDLAAYHTDLAVFNDYLAARPRGVNGDWNLFVTDDENPDGGSITSWAMLVVTTNSATGTLSTNEFTSTGGLTIPDVGNATPYPSTITVSGVTEAVTAVRVKFTGFSHTYPRDVDAFLVGPRGEVCALMSDAGGNDPGVSNLTLVFDDAAAALVPQITAPVSGSYRPTDYEPGEPLPPGGSGTIGTSLTALLLPAPTFVAEPIEPIAPVEGALWANEFTAPRVISQTVEVGQRLMAPTGEPGATGSYLAGHINLSAGTLFNPIAYQDPLAGGFAAANQGAIIPVNAIPGANQLEVWWFRPNTARAGLNAGDAARGFKSIYWPSVIGPLHHPVACQPA